MKFSLLALLLSCSLVANAQMKDLKDTASYAFGMLIGQNLKSQGMANLDMKIMSQAISDFMSGAPGMDMQQAQMVYNQYATQMREEVGKVARVEGEAFLAKNKTKAGVMTTASGLQYEVITPGAGVKPTATNKVTVHYTGTLIDGTKFDSSVDRGQPATFGLNGVIAGWTEGLQLMSPGAKYRFYIPFALAYGDRGSPPTIKPYAALIFDVELIKVE